jgi:hypothetical protein
VYDTSCMKECSISKNRWSGGGCNGRKEWKTLFWSQEESLQLVSAQRLIDMSIEGSNASDTIKACGDCLENCQILQIELRSKRRGVRKVSLPSPRAYLCIHPFDK